MVSPLRPQIAGGVYHAATRATGPSDLFRDAEDYLRFLAVAKHVVARYEWLLHSYCLMVTHYHLFLTTPKPNISSGMQLLNSLYARTFNGRHGRLGHLVAARYSSTLVESEGHALEVSRYVPLNPVRADLCARPEDYPWSSFGATIGLRREPSFLDSSWLLELFGGDLSTARRRLRDFVDAARASEALEASRGLALR